MFFDVVKGVFDVFCVEGFAVPPLHVVFKVEGDLHRVIRDFPRFGRIGDGFLGRVQLGQAVVHVLEHGVGIVVCCGTGAEGHGVAGFPNYQGATFFDRRGVFGHDEVA